MHRSRALERAEREAAAETAWYRRDEYDRDPVRAVDNEFRDARFAIYACTYMLGEQPQTRERYARLRDELEQTRAALDDFHHAWRRRQRNLVQQGACSVCLAPTADGDLCDRCAASVAQDERNMS